MTQRILVLAMVAVLMTASQSIGQEKKDSPASPSDISVDKIKKATAKQEPDAKAADAKAAGNDATKATDAQSSDSKSDSPKPVAEGTPVAQPDCNDGCNPCECDPCRKKCRGRLMSRLRSMFKRRCCCG